MSIKMCECLAATHSSQGGEHTEEDHYKGSCMSWPPCGGCWECICKQIAYYERDLDE